MQFSIPIYSLTGEVGCKQYLEASDSRIISKSFDFSFPHIQNACPVCTGPADAIWKGYYRRAFFCPKLDYSGRIWIRKGFCKSKKTHFSMLPDFCVPGIRWSKFMFCALLCFKDSSFFKSCPWEISFSTLYWIGALLVKLLRLNSGLMLLDPPATNSISELQNYCSEELHSLPFMTEFNWNKKIIPSALSPPV